MYQLTLPWGTQPVLTESHKHLSATLVWSIIQTGPLKKTITADLSAIMLHPLSSIEITGALLHC